MKFWPFSRKAKKGEDAIAEFWRWWTENAEPLADAIEAGAVQDWAKPISKRVHAIDRHLAWELGPGARSAHHFCLTSEGDRRRRVTCERWLAASPSESARWEYYPARQALSGDLEGRALKIGGAEVRFDELRLSLDADEMRQFVHVRATHPAFSQLSEDERGTATFLILDNALGEDGVERWIGNVDVDPGPSASSDVDLAVLRATLGAWADQPPGGAILEMQTASGPVVASVDFGVKRLDHLLMDTHCEIVIELEAPTENGLVDDAESAELNILEDQLLEATGNMAVFLGRETGLGRRVIHLHCDATGRVPQIIETWRAQHARRLIEVVVSHDPEWSTQHRW